MEFGAYELDAQGRRCYRPAVPRFPPLEMVWDLYEAAKTAITAFDAALTASPVRDATGKLFARHDAVHSSGAEGATTTFTDLLAYQSIGRAEDPADAASVAACAEAFEQLARQTDVRPQAMASAIHRRLFEHAADPMVAARAGLWKDYPNSTFDADAGGPFHYTHPDSVEPALDEWEAFTMANDRHPQLVRQVLSHWMFEHIHPFIDGNGRTGRLLLPLLLMQGGTTRQACAFMGEAVHRDKDLYIGALKHGRLTGDFSRWARSCMALIRQTAEANLQRLRALEGLQERWLAAVGGRRKHSAIHRLIPFAIVNPVFSVREAQRGIGGVFQTVNVAIEQLVALSMIRRRAEDQRRGRLFEVPAVLQHFEPPGKARQSGLRQ